MRNVQLFKGLKWSQRLWGVEWKHQKHQTWNVFTGFGLWTTQCVFRNVDFQDQIPLWSVLKSTNNPEVKLCLRPTRAFGMLTRRLESRSIKENIARRIFASLWFPLFDTGFEELYRESKEDQNSRNDGSHRQTRELKIFNERKQNLPWKSYPKCWKTSFD